MQQILKLANKIPGCGKDADFRASKDIPKLVPSEIIFPFRPTCGLRMYSDAGEVTDVFICKQCAVGAHLVW